MTTVFVCNDFIVADRVLTRGDETIHTDFQKLHVNRDKTIAIAVVGNVNFRNHHKTAADHFFKVVEQRYVGIPEPVLSKNDVSVLVTCSSMYSQHWMCSSLPVTRMYSGSQTGR